jgi:hypothetical protein
MRRRREVGGRGKAFVMFNSARVMWTVVVVVVVVVVALSVREARAQTDSRLAVGVSVAARAASSSDASGSADLGFELRLGDGERGWSWQNSFFGWFDTGVQESVATRVVGLGKLRVRPIIAGYGYNEDRSWLHPAGNDIETVTHDGDWIMGNYRRPIECFE